MKDFLEWIQTRQRREQREGEMSVGERQPRARQRLECVELAPVFGGTATVAGDAKAPASRTQSKRFAELGGAWYIAPAFGVRGACSAFWRDSSGRGRCQSAGRPDAIQTLRGT